MRCIGVIDDNPVTQLFFRDVFADRGWEVESWLSAQEVHQALLAPNSRRPDVIILDLHLHERDDGLQVLHELKTHDRTREVPVIMCSGDVWALQSLPEAIQEDVAAVLVKPFELDEAYQAVDYVLGSGKAPSSGSFGRGGRASPNT